MRKVNNNDTYLTERPVHYASGHSKMIGSAKVKKTIAILIILFASASFIFGQSKTRWELEWNISTATGDLGDWVDPTSFRGIEFGGSYEFETGFVAGASIGYAAFFKETERMTVEFDNGALTAKQFRDIYNYHIMAEGGYVFLNESLIRPYVKAGIGTFFTEQQLTIGLLYFDEDNWDFGMRPEIGAYYLNERASIGATVNAKFNYTPNYGNELDSFHYLSFGVGFLFQL